MAPIVDGMGVTASNTNTQLLDAVDDDTALGRLTLSNPLSESGSSVANIQKEHNSAANYMGKALNAAKDALPAWTNNDVGTSSNNLTARADALTGKFNPSSGHRHTGAAGDAPQILSTDVAGVRLRGYYVQGTDLSSVTGPSVTVTTQMAGKAASSGSTVKGVVVSASVNTVILRQVTGSNAGDQFRDASGNIVYGRITYAAPVWTLSFYTLVGTTETVYSFASATDVRWYYQEIYNPITDSPVYSELAVIPSDNVTADVITATTALQGKVSLATSATNIGSTTSAGTANASVANADHSHQGVHSIAKNGSTALYSDVTLSAGQNIALTQSSQDISIAFSGVLPLANGGTNSTDGSITGSGALSFTAGGTNQNLILAPSGTGLVYINGNVGIKTTSSDIFNIGTFSTSVNIGSTTGVSALSISSASGSSAYLYMGATNIESFFINASSGSTILSNIGAVPIVFGIGGSEKVRIDSDGSLLVGSNTNRGRQLTLEGTGTTGQNIVRNSNDASGGALVLAKTRSTSVGGITTVTTGDALGTLRFAGADGTNFDNPAAEILGNAEGTISTGVIPGRMTFRTASSAGTMTERMRIDSVGYVGIGTVSPASLLHVNGSVSVGSSSGQNGRFTLFTGSYSVPTGTYVAITLRDGVSTLANGDNYRIRLFTQATSSTTGATYLVYQTAAGTWTSKLVSANNLTSNSPQLRVNGTSVEVFHLHASTYGITAMVEGYVNGNLTVTSPNFFGIEAHMANLSGNIGIGTDTPGAKLEVANGSIIMYREAASCQLINDVYGAGTPTFYGRKAQGTRASPTASNSGDILLTINGNGHDGTSFVDSRVQITMATEEAWTGSAQGTRIGLVTTPIGGTGGVTRLTIKGSGNVGIGTTAPSARLHVEHTVPVASPSWTASDTAIFSQTSNSILQLHAGATGGLIGIGFSVASTRSDGYISYDTTNQAIYLGTASVERFRITSTGSVIVGTAALATNATNGFFYIPTCAGTPTGTPTSQTGRVPMVCDSTTNKFYLYVGGTWKSVTLA